METVISALSADKPQTDGVLGLVYVYEIGFILFDLIESSTDNSSMVLTGRVREVLCPIPSGRVVPDECYIKITTKEEYSTAVLYSEKSVLSLPQNEKGE